MPDVPYPSSSTVEYRLNELERWRAQVEREGIAATLAVMKVDIVNLRADVADLKKGQADAQIFMTLNRGENEHVKKLFTWVLAAVAILGVALPYLIGVPGAG